MIACPCGSGHDYAACCGRWHAGTPAPTAEALMRSRYSAFAMQLEPYLLDTWHPGTRPASVGIQPGIKWLGLSVKAVDENGASAQVEFVARSRIGGAPAVRMHERSRFVRENGRWLYVDGDDLSRPRS